MAEETKEQEESFWFIAASVRYMDKMAGKELFVHGNGVIRLKHKRFMPGLVQRSLKKWFVENKGDQISLAHPLIVIIANQQQIDEDGFHDFTRGNETENSFSMQMMRLDEPPPVKLPTNFTMELPLLVSIGPRGIDNLPNPTLWTVDQPQPPVVTPTKKPRTAKNAIPIVVGDPPPTRPSRAGLGNGNNSSSDTTRIRKKN